MPSLAPWGSSGAASQDAGEQQQQGLWWPGHRGGEAGGLGPSPEPRDLLRRPTRSNAPQADMRQAGPGDRRPSQRAGSVRGLTGRGAHHRWVTVFGDATS